MAGRPTKMTEATVAKLEEAFSLGCTDLEACLFADIDKATLYRYQEKNPSFCDRKELLKENPILIARKSVIQGMEEDSNLALKYLERKKKDEFSIKQEHDMNLNHTLEARIRAEVESELLDKKMGADGAPSHAEKLLEKRS